MKRLYIFLFAIFVAGGLRAQQQMGLANDNWNITEGIRLNPAFSVDPKPWLDIHIVGVYAFVGNNYAYWAKEDFSLFKKQIPEDVSQNRGGPNGTAQLEAFLLGPAFNLSLGKFSVGLNTALRNYGIGRNVPQSVSENLIDGFQVSEYYNTPRGGNNFRIKTMSWAEIGLNGGYIAYQEGTDIIKVGANIKYIFGLGGADFIMNDLQYTMLNDSIMVVDKMESRYGGSVTGFYPGSGWGLDLGVTYEKKLKDISRYKPHSKSSNCEYIDYQYKVGLSILDIGGIKYKRDSFYRQIEDGQTVWFNYGDFNPESIREAVAGLDQQFRRSLTASENSYTARLPTSISVQFDYNFGYGIYLNSTVNFGWRYRKKFGAERMHMFSVTPRIERKHWGIALPMSVNETLHPGVGLSLRFWFLSVGTDNFIPLLFDVDVYRMDAYFHLKIPILDGPMCKSKQKHDKQTWRVNDCSGPSTHYTPDKKKKKKKR